MSNYHGVVNAIYLDDTFYLSFMAECHVLSDRDNCVVNTKMCSNTHTQTHRPQETGMCVVGQGLCASEG